MSYSDEIARQHNTAKEGFGDAYEFSVKQRDIIYLVKTDLQTTVKKRCKTEWHIKKTKREIENLYKHLMELEDKLEELTYKEDDQINFLEAALDFKESTL